MKGQYKESESVNSIIHSFIYTIQKIYFGLQKLNDLVIYTHSFRDCEVYEEEKALLLDQLRHETNSPQLSQRQ